MKLEGSLDAFSLPDVFALLAMTKKTGGLYLQHETARGVVFFTEGALTGGSSDLTRQVLARRLVAAGHADDDALTAAVAAAKDDRSVGVVKALRDAGAVDGAALQAVVTEHLVDTVFDLLRWPEGTFAFQLDEANPDDVGATMLPEEAVTEARQRLADWATVAESVPSPATVLSVALSLAEDPTITRDEWSLLALVDGHRSVAEIVALTGRGDYAVVSRLADLVQRGLLRSGASDGVDAMLRRQAALAALEDAPPAPVRASVPAQGVTPERPEPFLAPRRPAHPDGFPPSLVGAVDGATAMAPQPLITDPHINRSMLLRLIAGVRGL